MSKNPLTRLEITTSVVVPSVSRKVSPPIYLVLLYLLFLWIFTFSSLFVLSDSQPFESGVALSLGLGVVRDVASAIISHEQTQ